jgi:hypothetical protein
MVNLDNHIDNVFQQSLPLTKPVVVPQSSKNQNMLWKLYFDGSSSREGARACLVLFEKVQGACLIMNMKSLTCLTS